MLPYTAPWRDKLVQTIITMIRFCVLLGWLLAAPAWGATYTAYNTYLYPPFVHADGSGLARDMVALLNRHMGEDRFVLANVPRARFLVMASQAGRDFDGIALFLVPRFVEGRLPPGRYLWSAPIFRDFNVLVFRATHQPSGPLPGALHGWRFGAVRGNTYTYVDPLVARGAVQRDEGADELGNLRKLAAGRIDFTQLNQMNFRQLNSDVQDLQGLVAVMEPGSMFQRHILLSRHAPEALRARLAAVLARLPQDREWQQLAARYGVQLPAAAPRPRLAAAQK